MEPTPHQKGQGEVVSKWAGGKVYDVELNDDKDRVELWRKGRVSHRWTREEAQYIKDMLDKLVPMMHDQPHTESKVTR